MKTLAIIPARMAATRFPGKPLRPILGIPMIGHIYLRTKECSQFDHVYVATCDQEIADYIESIGGHAVMTSHLHERCTDRTAEALLKIEAIHKTSFDIVGMIQGDEPLVMPAPLDQAVMEMKKDPHLKIVNLMTEIASESELTSPNTVKVVTNPRGEAIYFSREPIPSPRKGASNHIRYKQTGLIFFLRDYLLQFNQLPSTPLEIAESVDMLRVIEHGEKIKMVPIKTPCIGVDVPEDIKAVEDFMQKDSLYSLYANRSEVRV